MAAMSLRPRASAFQPTSWAAWVERRKWTSFDQHVGGEQQVFAGTARTEDGAIVADAEGQPTGAATWGHGGQAGDVVDGRLFVDRAFVLDHTKGR